MFLERWDKMYALQGLHKKSFHKKRKIAFAAVFLTGLSMAFSVESFADGPGDALGKAGNVIISEDVGATVSDEYAGWYGYTNQDGSDFLYLEKGTEVSRFQNENGQIDWDMAKRDGLDFVMVRLAYGTKEDAYFDANVKGAQKAGIKVGVYLCSTAKNMTDAMAEADLTLKKLNPYKLDYPVAYDLEVASMLSEGLGKEDLTAMVNAYCKKMQDAGFIPMVYANRTWLTKHMNLSDIPYDVWFAAYPENRVYVPVDGSKTTIWQSSEKGMVKGIKGLVTTEFSWKVYGGGNPSKKNAGNRNMESNNTSSTSSGGSSKNATTGKSVQKNETSSASDGTVVSGVGPGKTTPTVENGWVQSLPGQWKFMENGNAVTGWKLVKNLWYYMDGQGIMQTGWLFNTNRWYYLKDSGEMAVNWQYVNGKWYWLNQDGAMRTGWKLINNVWYYMEDSGAMLENTTRNINGADYRFDANGAWMP